MTYDELVKKIRKIRVLESRINENNLKEFVIRTQDIMPLHLILKNFFGEQFKAPGQSPSLEDKKKAARWGGIRQYQTVYYKENRGVANCVMLWPWQDGSQCTVKIVRWQ